MSDNGTYQKNKEGLPKQTQNCYYQEGGEEKNKRIL